jgi:hypothetical protein
VSEPRRDDATDIVDMWDNGRHSPTFTLYPPSEGQAPQFPAEGRTTGGYAITGRGPVESTVDEEIDPEFSWEIQDEDRNPYGRAGNREEEEVESNGFRVAPNVLSLLTEGVASSQTIRVEAPVSVPC